MGWAGSELDVASVYAAHAPFVRSVLARHGVRPDDLDDVLQDAFVTIQRVLPTFDGRSSLQTWLYSVAWRVASDYKRRQRRRDEVAAVGELVAGSAVETMADKRFHAKLGALDDEYRDVIALHDVAGFSVSEVAEYTGRARATVRAKVEQARKALGRQLMRAVASSHEAGWFDGLAPEVAARLARPDRPRVYERICEGAAISRLDDIVFILWRGQSSVAGLEALLEVMHTAADEHPEGIRHMCIIESTSTAPSREARKLLSWGAGKMGPKLRAAAHVVEDVAMMSAAARLINACFFVGGEPFGLRFFEHVAPASDWVSQYGATEADAIVDHIERMRRALDAQ